MPTNNTINTNSANEVRIKHVQPNALEHHATRQHSKMLHRVHIEAPATLSKTSLALEEVERRINEETHQLRLLL